MYVHIIFPSFLSFNSWMVKHCYNDYQPWSSALILSIRKKAKDFSYKNLNAFSFLTLKRHWNHLVFLLWCGGRPGPIICLQSLIVLQGMLLHHLVIHSNQLIERSWKSIIIVYHQFWDNWQGIFVDFLSYLYNLENSR